MFTYEYYKYFYKRFLKDEAQITYYYSKQFPIVFSFIEDKKIWVGTMDSLEIKFFLKYAIKIKKQVD